MSISSSNANKSIVSGSRYTFPVNCNNCQYDDINTGCVFNRCMYLELPKPNSLEINKKCSICDKEMVRPVYSTETICEDCRNKIKDLISKDGGEDEGK